MTSTTISVFIKKLDGEKKELKVHSSSTIVDLKKLLAEKVGIDFKQLNLVFKGSPLLNDATFTELKINDGDTIHMILQLNGG